MSVLRWLLLKGTPAAALLSSLSLCLPPLRAHEGSCGLRSLIRDDSTGTHTRVFAPAIHPTIWGRDRASLTKCPCVRQENLTPGGLLETLGSFCARSEIGAQNARAREDEGSFSSDGAFWMSALFCFDFCSQCRR